MGFLTISEGGRGGGGDLILWSLSDDSLFFGAYLNQSSPIIYYLHASCSFGNEIYQGMKQTV